MVLLTFGVFGSSSADALRLFDLPVGVFAVGFFAAGVFAAGVSVAGGSAADGSAAGNSSDALCAWNHVSANQSMSAVDTHLKGTALRIEATTRAPMASMRNIDIGSVCSTSMPIPSASVAWLLNIHAVISLNGRNMDVVPALALIPVPLRLRYGESAAWNMWRMLIGCLRA